MLPLHHRAKPETHVEGAQPGQCTTEAAFSGSELGRAYPCFFSILAQESLSVTVRLNTGAPGFESSASAQK